MDRGIPTEEVLSEMRSSVPPIYYLVGTPKGRLSKLETDLLERPWQSVRPGVEVKVCPKKMNFTFSLRAGTDSRRNGRCAVVSSKLYGNG